MAALAPMPSASVAMTVSDRPRARDNDRTAILRSRRKVIVGPFAPCLRSIRGRPAPQVKLAPVMIRRTACAAVLIAGALAAAWRPAAAAGDTPELMNWIVNGEVRAALVYAPS